MTQHIVQERPSTDDSARLRKIIQEREEEIRFLRAELARKPQVEYVEKPEPKMIRMAEETQREIRYEKDPYLIEQNARLSRELQNALVGYCSLERRTKCKA